MMLTPSEADDTRRQMTLGHDAGDDRYIISRQMRSAAKARDELAPKAVIVLMNAASSVPRPPGVMGIASASRATANDVNTAIKV